MESTAFSSVKKHILALLLLLALTIGLFASCGTQTADVSADSELSSVSECSDYSEIPYTAKYGYTEKAYPMIFEPLGTGEITPQGCASLQLEGNTYYFTHDISFKDRDVFVDNQLELFKFLKSKNISVPALTIYLISNYVNRTESDNNKAFYGDYTSGTYMQVLTTLQVIFSDYTNYGLLYAMSNNIAAELSWKCDDVNTEAEGLVDFLHNKPEYLSLTYPCFDSIYSEKSEIAYSKVLSLKLYTIMDKCDVFSENRESAFSAVAESFAEKNGIEYTPVHFGFAYNGPCCPLKMRTKFLEIFRHLSYVEDYYCYYIGKDLFADYTIMLKTLKSVDSDIENVRNIFGFDNTDLVPVRLCSEDDSHKYYFGLDDVGGLYSNFKMDGANILLVSASAAVHEYVHYMYDVMGGYDDPEADEWNTETLAYYFGNFSYIEYKINLNMLGISGIFEVLAGKKYTEIKDCFLLSDIYCYQRKIYRYSDGVDWCSSFARYFVEVYGESTFIQAMFHPSKIAELTGKSAKDITADWKSYLINTYSYLSDFIE